MSPPVSPPVSTVTTHVLDTARGRPAADLAVRLHRLTGQEAELVAQMRTDEDGRVLRLGPDDLPAGTYRLVFDTAAYFTATGQRCFFPEVGVVFTLTDPAEHHHVPLLLSPFAYSTYRGS